MSLSSILKVAVVACFLLLDIGPVNAKRTFEERFKAPKEKRKEALAAHQARETAKLESRGTKNYRYLTNDTSPYRVKSLPLVNANIGEMYSGLIPIESNDTSRALFFVFEPTTGDPRDEVTIWLNGGPGCSSLEGFFQENGRFTWQPGTYRPVENEYSWVNLTNMLWVEQPVGTGFSIGTVTATREEDIAADFVKFFKNFQMLFGIKNYRIFVTGESYAGRYVPYISAAMLDEHDSEYFDLQGALVYDPCIGDCGKVQVQTPTVPMVNELATLFNFNATFMQTLQDLHQSCGYADYLDQYLVFPPSGMQPNNRTYSEECDLNDLVDFAACDPNPCFNPYDVSQMCPVVWDVLGFPTLLEYSPPGWTNYFDRDDVKRAMHAPTNVTWGECAPHRVFVHGDKSVDSIIKVLPQVIETTNRVLVSNGDYDMVVLTAGTLLAIQNMTWNGLMGFQTAPATPIDITLPDLQYQAAFSDSGYDGWDGPQGTMGVQHLERGLMWAETYQSGHMGPQFQPRASYRHIQWVLGRIQTL